MNLRNAFYCWSHWCEGEKHWKYEQNITYQLGRQCSLPFIYSIFLNIQNNICPPPHPHRYSFLKQDMKVYQSEESERTYFQKGRGRWEKLLDLPPAVGVFDVSSLNSTKVILKVLVPWVADQWVWHQRLNDCCCIFIYLWPTCILSWNTSVWMKTLPSLKKYGGGISTFIVKRDSLLCKNNLNSKCVCVCAKVRIW